MAILDQRGDGFIPEAFTGPPASLAGNKLVASISKLSYQHRLDDTVFLYGFGQPGQLFLVEQLPGLAGGRPDLFNINFQKAFLSPNRFPDGRDQSLQALTQTPALIQCPTPLSQAHGILPNPWSAGRKPLPACRGLALRSALYSSVQ